MNANDLFKAVMQLDLEPIKIKLMHVASGEGWSLDKAKAVEKEYRRFLCLMKLFPEEDTAPLVDVDTFWHYHILDTMKYAADCEQVFGYFLHHYPHIGLGDSEEEDQLRFESGDRMRELYEATFGEAYAGWSTGQIEADGERHDATRDGLDAHPAGVASAIAFSAGPSHDKLPALASGKASAIAFSAGPSHDKLPARAAGKASAIAFSAGPSHDKLPARAAGKASAIAFSAGPSHDKLTARATGKASAIAFSAGPSHDKLPARAAGKASAIAFSAGPSHGKLNPHAMGSRGIPDFRGGPASGALATQREATTN